MIPGQFLSRTALNVPNKIAYYCGDKSWTWTEVHVRASRFATAFRDIGAEAGDVIAILGQESIEIYDHFLACMCDGFVRVGVNWRYSPVEVMHVLKDSGARFLLVDGRCQALFDMVKELALGLGITLVGYRGASDCQHDYEKLTAKIADGRGQSHNGNVDPKSPLLITYTSGSTGQPKGVVHTQTSVANIILQSVIGRGLSPDDVWYTAAASSWMTVLLNVQGIANGMSHVIMDGTFEIGHFMRDVERRRATAVMLVPTLIARAIEETRKHAYDVSSVRLLMYGSAPATPELIRATYDTFGCDLVQSYGMTEAGWITQLSARDHRRAISGEIHLLRSVGRAGAMSEIAICEPDGTSVPTGQSGEIWVRGELLMQGYRNLPRETAEVFSDSWLKTNDIGRMDEHGYLYLQDRKNLMIITGAVNVFPSGIETVIREHADVDEVVVVGAPHPEWGEAVVAVVQTRRAVTMTPADIIAFAGTKLSRMECPKHVLFVREFPLTVNGKINKVAVRSWVAEQKASLPWMRSRPPDSQSQAV